MKKYTGFSLFLILAGCFLVRLYRFNNPVADWHSWRQADTSAVSRNFVQYGFDLLHPRFDDLSNVPSGIDNPNGYRFVEFPIYNVAQAGLFKLFGIFTLEEWGRLVSIFSSVAATLFLYLIVSKHSNKSLGLLSAFFYAFIPYNIYYGRTILPDTSMAMAVLGGIYFFDKWIEKSIRYKVLSIKYWVPLVLSILFTACSFLLKPYALFFTLPMMWLAWKRFGLSIVKQWQLYMFGIISVLPLILWRRWIVQFPEGIAASSWLLNGNGIRFHPMFFRWIFYERLTKLISGYIGIFIFIFGLLRITKLKDAIFFLSFLLSSLLYVVVFATGNVQHDYYQILIMPSVAIFFAIGSYYLFSWTLEKLPIGKLVLFIAFIGLLGFGWYQVRDYFNVNNPSIVIAGNYVDKIAAKNAKVIANYNGDTSFLYQTKRQGWPSYEKPIPQMVAMGADYLVIANPVPKDAYYAQFYKIIAKTPQYVLFDLHQKP